MRGYVASKPCAALRLVVYSSFKRLYLFVPKLVKDNSRFFCSHEHKRAIEETFVVGRDAVAIIPNVTKRFDESVRRDWPLIHPSKMELIVTQSAMKPRVFLNQSSPFL